eukprot:4149396-Prymnesium_polylepis.1
MGQQARSGFLERSRRSLSRPLPPPLDSADGARALPSARPSARPSPLAAGRSSLLRVPSLRSRLPSRVPSRQLPPSRALASRGPPRRLLLLLVALLV